MTTADLERLEALEAEAASLRRQVRVVSAALRDVSREQVRDA